MKKGLILMITALLSVFATFGQEITYKIGDLYDVDGIKGIIFSIEDGGRHGKIVALENSGDRVLWGNPVFFIEENSPVRWYYGSHSKSDNDGVTVQMVAKAFSGATDYNDGAYNCDKIVDNYISEEGNYAKLYCSPLSDMVHSYLEWPQKLPSVSSGISADSFYKFDMAEKLPSYKYNWYIPAFKELEELYGACAQDDLNEKLINAGGIPLKGRYWSSTEIKHHCDKFDIDCSPDAFVYDMNDGYEFGWRKNDAGFKIRLIRRF